MRKSSNVPCLHLRGWGCAPLSLLPPPSPGVRLTHFLFDPAPGARTHASLPTPLPFPHSLLILYLFFCPPLCLPLIHLALTRCRQGTPSNTSEPPNVGRSKASVQYICSIKLRIRLPCRQILPDRSTSVLRRTTGLYNKCPSKDNRAL